MRPYSALLELNNTRLANIRKMKIPYKKKQLNINLFLGLIWLIYAVILTVINENSSWIDYGWFVMGIAYLILYFYQKNEQYLTIENGIIKQNWPFGKKLNLIEIKYIRYFAGDLILKTDERNLSINGALIDEKTYDGLKDELKKLNAEWI